MAGWPRNHSSHVTWLAWPWHMRTTSRKSQSLPLPLNTRKTFRMFRTKSFNLSLQDLQEGTQMTGNENDWGIGRSELSFKKKRTYWVPNFQYLQSFQQLPWKPWLWAPHGDPVCRCHHRPVPERTLGSWCFPQHSMDDPWGYWPKNGQTSFKYVLMGIAMKES